MRILVFELSKVFWNWLLFPLRKWWTASKFPKKPLYFLYLFIVDAYQMHIYLSFFSESFGCSLCSWCTFLSFVRSFNKKVAEETVYGFFRMLLDIWFSPMRSIYSLSCLSSRYIYCLYRYRRSRSFRRIVMCD